MNHPTYKEKLSPEMEAKWLAEEKELFRIMLAALNAGKVKLWHPNSELKGKV